jgi:hypothetical protein
MGYFSTRAEAQRWVEILLPHYPSAFVAEMRKLIPQPSTDAHDLPVDEDSDGLWQPHCTTLNTRFLLS